MVSAQLEFTSLGFGTAPLGNLYRAISDAEANRTLEAAWSSGVRYFDTAPLYGLTLSEKRLGRFLKSKPRDEYILSTKVGRLLLPCDAADRTGYGSWFDVPNMREHFDYSYRGVMKSFEQSIERLGIDQIDILFVHDLCVFTHGSRAKSDARILEFLAGDMRRWRSLGIMVR